MKIKRTIYLVLVIIGGLIAGYGDKFMEEEFALMIGFVLLMFGLYKSTQLWSSVQLDERERNKEDGDGF
ncbi:hypothetical protein DHD08_14830 [Arenibacter sp. H213]|uniref:Uncharacterized protein n=1 Tax=Arenibacter antarcticus TaxID=2040469 RepID=A0ABW5VNZ4_9FLAO|nr:hypothetical protein [Arenibacter sp. H213]MCM4168959.1 hypothetical protein [Arenibacter sp. H213]